MLFVNKSCFCRLCAHFLENTFTAYLFNYAEDGCFILQKFYWTAIKTGFINLHDFLAL